MIRDGKPAGESNGDGTPVTGMRPEAVSSNALFSPTDFNTWWKSEAHHYNPMMGESIFQFAERMAEMAYGQGVIEGMDRQRMGVYPENA